jgi:hypothetical protein
VEWRQVQYHEAILASQLTGARGPAAGAVSVEGRGCLHLGRQAAGGRPRQGAAVGVEVEHGNGMAARGERAGEVDGKGGLADPTLQIAAGDDLAHGASVAGGGSTFR